MEDEAAIADFLARGLAAEGYDVACEASGDEGEHRAVAEDFDLVILDLMLPGRNGFDALDAIRAAKPRLPVILLTARGEVEDRVAGLDRGATDYMTKPFAFEELAARVRAHIRHAHESDPAVLEVGALRLDLVRREVERGGEPIRLSPREFDLLAYFARHPGQVLSQQQILAAVWGYRHDPKTNAVGVYVNYLRRKLALPDRPAPIETVRSVGYRLARDG